MKISHLVTNGCSFTYGQGLWDPPNEAWPKLLADKLKVPIVNLAIPGASNDSITRRTYEYFYENLKHCNNPFFVIAMSGSTRREEYISQLNGHTYQAYKELYPTDNTIMSKTLFKEIDSMGISMSEVRKVRLWASIINLFENHKIPYLTADYIPTAEEYVIDYAKTNHPGLYDYVNKNPNKVKNLNQLTLELPKALDGSHDGVEAQHVIADYLHEQILRRYKNIEPSGNFKYLSLKDYCTEERTHFKNCNKWYRKEMNLEYSYGID